MWSALVFPLISLLFLTVEAAETECDKKLKISENEIKKIVLLSDELALPKNAADVGNYCKEAKKGLKAIREYQNCVKGFPQQIYNVLIGSFSNIISSNCGKNISADAVAHQVRCFTPKVVDKCYDCMDDISRRINYVVDNVDKEMIPYLCCTIHMVGKCLYTNVKSTCGEGKEDGADFMKKTMDTLFHDINRLVCRKLPSITECKKTEPAIVNTLQNLVKTRNTGQRMFFMKPLIRLAKKVGS